jgi:hypothetical protein
VNWKAFAITVLIVFTLLLPAACAGGPTFSPPPSSKPTPTPTSTAVFSQYQLAYRLLANYPDFFWCDSDFYPIAREGGEQANALQQFPTIQANTAELSAILEHLSLPPKTDYTDAEKLSIYREHKLITRAVTVTLSESIYTFSIRTGQNQGKHYEGTITPSGQIKVTKEETSFNTCPICLTKGTLINTPAGQLPVELLQPGMIVWTLDDSGYRVSAPVFKTSSTPVPSSFTVVRVSLRDGRNVTASFGHPTAEMRPLGNYRVGDLLDSSTVTSVEQMFYYGGATYDLLPSGGKGLYWANGILLGSTLSQ